MQHCRCHRAGSEATQEQEAGTTKTASCVHLLRRPGMQAGSRCSHEAAFVLFCILPVVSHSGNFVATTKLPTG